MFAVWPSKAQSHKRRPARAWPRPIWTIAVAAAVIAVVAIPAPASAEPGLDIRSTNKYVLDPDDSVLRFTGSVTLTNESPDQGNTYFFWTEFGLPVPAGVENLSVTSNGSPLRVRYDSSDDPNSKFAVVTLPRELLYRQSQTLDISYEVPGEKPRSKDFTRIGDGYANFAAYGPGDPGQVTVEVVLPKSMKVDSTTSDFDVKTGSKSTTLKATDTNFPDGFWAVVSARDPERVDNFSVVVDGVTFGISAWPGDEPWAQFVKKNVREGLPVLQGYVGAAWPGGSGTVIREDTSVNVRGYDGWFDPAANEIVVGEALDAHVLFHELSHAWSSDQTLESRWMSEGLSEVLANRTAVELGLKPLAIANVSPSDKDAIKLNSWEQNADSRAQENDDFGYAASYQVMTALLKGTDTDEFTDIVSAAISGESAYASNDTGVESADLESNLTDWRNLLDLLEERGGNPEAAGILTRWVLAADERAELADRAAARKLYSAYDQADGPWLPPKGLRTAMDDWEFDTATRDLAALSELGQAVSSLQETAEITGIDVPNNVQSTYTLATGDGQSITNALLPIIASTETAIEAVDEAAVAVAKADGPLSGLGMAVTGAEADLDNARQQLAEGQLSAAASEAASATTKAQNATGLALGAIVALIAGLFGLLFAVRAIGRRRKLGAENPKPEPAWVAWGPGEPNESTYRAEPMPGASPASPDAPAFTTWGQPPQPK